MNDERIEAIQERRQQVPGRWQWERCYELGDDGLHWTLVDPDHRTGEHGHEVVVNGFLVLHTDSEKDFAGEPLQKTPHFEFIANAPADIDFLLAEVARLHKAIEDAATELICAGTTDGAHHKQWGIDQALLHLFGGQRHERFMLEMELEGGVTWDRGVAP